MIRPLARLAGVTRRFGPVVALDGADLELRAGEVHGVLGENGAGKTTLLSTLGGMLQPDDGVIEIDGSEVSLRTPRDAWRLGIGLVHQHFTLVPTLSVLENLTLGRRSSGRGIRLPFDAVRSEASELADRTGLAIDFDAPVEGLTVGQRQRVEILKVLLREPRILVLDEPTAVLAPAEIDALFELLRTWAGQGRAVALVAHKLDEVLRVADRVTVLRAGRTVLSSGADEIGVEELVRAMVGASLPDTADRAGSGGVDDSREVVATLANHRPGGLADASMTDGYAVRRGEIVGIAGVEGNGQRDLALELAGRGKSRATGSIAQRKVGFIPQDRSTEGIVGDFDLAENLALAVAGDEEFARGPFLDWKAVEVKAEELRSRYEIRAPSVKSTAGALSGGNQQRLVVAREISVARDLLVAENPTRGLDVAATRFVREELVRLASLGDGAPGIVLHCVEERVALAAKRPTAGAARWQRRPPG